MAQGVIQMKVISARTLRVEGVLPEVRKVLQEEGRIDRRMLEQTTRTWKHRPHFQYVIAENVGSKGTGVAVETYTTDKVYNMLDEGTRKHTIVARKAMVLRFKVKGFRAKTKPRTIGSGMGSPGREWRAKEFVHHPGTKPRHWYDEVKKRRLKLFRAKIQFAVNKALERNKR